MLCVNCGKEVVKTGEEEQIHYNGKGTYLHCQSCDAKNYTETDSDDGGSKSSN